MAHLRTLLVALLAVPPATSHAQAGQQPHWSFDLQAYHYFVPDEPDFLLPMALADRGALHLEVRYNYEDRDTFSAFVGRSWSLGHLALTPMAGVAVGNTDGLVPGLEVEFTMGRLEAWIEAEYLFDLHGSDGNYFYAWGEASYRVAPWGALGMMSQRTRTFRADVDADWGLLARVGPGPVQVLAYLIDPAGDPFWMVGLEATF